VLARAGFVVRPGNGGTRLVEADDPAHLNRTRGEAGVWLEELVPVRRDPESVFLELTAADTLGADQPSGGLP